MMLDSEKTKKSLKIERRTDGQLWTEHDGKDVVLHVQPCFPWTSPQQHISLRDDADNEVALISDLAEVDSTSRSLIEEALSETAFVMEVDAVIDRTEEFEIRTWEVQTKQGRRKFQTKRDEWPTTMPDGSLMIRDVAGDLFRVSEPKAMDTKSRKYLAPFID